MKKMRVVLTVSVLAASIVGALQWSRGQTGVHLQAVENSAGQGGQKAATAATIAANTNTAHNMPPVDPDVEADIQRGFIRAEIVAYDDLIKAGGMAEAKKHGTVRMEGKTYIVKDGDVCHFLFNV